MDQGVMNMARFLAQRHLSALVLSVVMVVFMAAPAAAGGTVSCGSGGYLFTMGKSTGAQYHWVDDYGLVGPLTPGGTWSVSWGLKSGTHQWDVWGIGVYWENSVCPI